MEHINNHLQFSEYRVLMFSEEERGKWSQLPHPLPIARRWSARAHGRLAGGGGGVCRTERDDASQEFSAPTNSPPPETVSSARSPLFTGAMWSFPFLGSFPWFNISDPLLFSAVLMDLTFLWAECMYQNCSYLKLASARFRIPSALIITFLTKFPQSINREIYI